MLSASIVAYLEWFGRRDGSAFVLEVCSLACVPPLEDRVARQLSVSLHSHPEAHPCSYSVYQKTGIVLGFVLVLGSVISVMFKSSLGTPRSLLEAQIRELVPSTHPPQVCRSQVWREVSWEAVATACGHLLLDPAERSLGRQSLRPAATSSLTLLKDSKPLSGLLVPRVSAPSRRVLCPLDSHDNEALSRPCSSCL
jgi:hypothetical protein